MMLKNQLSNVFIKLMGRSLAWRLGRSLYMTARGEAQNDIHSNGEEMLLSQMASSGCAVIDGQRPVVIVDCGANVGNWTAAAIDKFRMAGVPASFLMFEPSPKSCEFINQRFGSSEQVSLHKIALSNQSGSFDFFMASPMGGTNSLIPLIENHNETISVRTEKGSDYFADLGITEISLLKIDTEGNDFSVLEGFEEMLASHQIKVVQFEYNHRWLPTGKSMRSVFELARKHGYDVGRTDPKCIEVYADWNAEIDRFFEWNYLLLAPGMTERLHARRMRWGACNTLVPA
jgi:FkbM family methyltransferase